MVNKCRGFTLFELLVSMSLLSLIILIGSSGFALFSERWDGRLGRFDGTMTAARNLMLVQDALASLIPFVALDRDQNAQYYFEGNRNGFVAVSTKSVAAPGRPAVVRLSVTQNDDSTFDLVYEEWPMTDNVLRDTFQRIPFYQPLVLFSGISEPQFTYLGWKRLVDRYGEDEFSMGSPPEWLPSYNALEASDVPVKVSLSFVTDSGLTTLMSEVAEPAPGLLDQYRDENALY